MKGFEGRLFAIYLEHLPPHLKLHSADYTKADFKTILSDSASALDYIASQGLSHNDLKPLNITFSREREAVLIDFGLATSVDSRGGGGTPRYVPPEYLHGGFRGAPGDVWALGITMMDIMDKFSVPHALRRGWSIIEAATDNTKSNSMMKAWLKEVQRCRNNLGREDLVEATLFDMLDDSPQTRITAKEIVARLSPSS